MRVDRSPHIVKTGLALLVVLLSPTFCRGQCERGTARAFIDVNGIRATVKNWAGWGYGQDPFFLEAPKGSGHTAIFAHALWMGGKVHQQLRLAAAKWSYSDYFPGPLTPSGDAPTDCMPFDRIWVVNREDLAELDATGAPTDDIRDWPYTAGAEVMDGDGVPGNYDLRGGDRPRMYGDQMAYWVVNDAAGEHSFSLTEPIGVEVQGLAFAFDRPRYLQSTIFFRNRITYRGKDRLDDAYLGLWSNIQLGWTSGDYAGADTLLDMGFAYESDNQVDPSWDGFPPALGIVMIKTPVVHDVSGARELGMTTFVETRSTTSDGDGARPGTDDAYRFMRGYWQDGSPVTEGGYGWGGVKPTTIMFPGDPVGQKYWSMENVDSLGGRHIDGDPRIIQASGPFSMDPGDSQELDYAIIWARGADRFGSITVLREMAAEAVRDYGALIRPTSSPSDEPDLSFKLDHYPKPVSGSAMIEYGVPQGGDVTIALFDVLGRRVDTLEDGFHQAGQHRLTFRGDALPDGLYFYVMTIANRFIARRTMVVMHE
ncbi:MAG: hypothetical protein WBW88_02985 [Rhodothermales bacterium]